MKREIKRPLKRRFIIGCVVFVLTLCIGLGLINYSGYKGTLYGQYEDYLSNLLRYTAQKIDVDDLAECIRTGKESEKFKELQSFLDNLKDNIRLDWVYIIVPLNTEPRDNIKNVIAGNSKEEYKGNNNESSVYLNMLTGDSYSPEIAGQYLKAFLSEGISYFEDDTEWGDMYTSLMTLYDSQGNKVAALCIDIDVKEIHTKLRDHVTAIIFVTVVFGAIFAMIYIVWIEVNVSKPIIGLEKAVSKFAGISHLHVPPEELILETPEIHTGNEVEVLSDEIDKMGSDFRKYAKDLAKAEKEAEDKSLALRETLAVAESANKAKTAFLSKMSHEIRTPMNAIIGLDNIALNDPDLSESTRDYLEKINTSARHLLNIINDILDVSRIESGKMVLKNEAFSFADSIGQVNTIISGQCKEKGLEYNYSTTGKIDEYYVGDQVKLNQALINIMGNAVKYTPEGGKVSLEIAEGRRLDGMATLKFFISDTGIGMSSEFVEHIFDPFSQEDGSYNNKYGSTGLGMAITRAIVEMMNGNIAVKSEKNKGTTFRVTVTLGEYDGSTEIVNDIKEETEDMTLSEDISGAAGLTGEASPAPSESEKEGEKGVNHLAGKRVLMAEDVDINAEIMTMVLGMREVEVDLAVNGRIAVDKFADHPAGYYDAILMDMRMPEMDGLEATRTIREMDREDAAVIPIIALTANAFEEDVQRSMQSGLNAHLSKPVEPDVLFETLEKFILKMS